MGYYRRGHVNFEAVLSAVELEVLGSGCTLGYRAMSQRIRSRYGLSVTRDLVSEIQRAVDPEGVESRRRRRLRRRVYSNQGPNFLIHVDGYDKMKQYGFAIHAAICGFSRRVLWYRVSRSNNDPNIIATYFMEYVKEIKGVPRCVRSDDGTENVLIQDLQVGMRWNHSDDMAGSKSFLRGSSPSNQRIERWWRSSREGGGCFWIDMMKSLESRGLFSTSNPVHIECARFCFTDLLVEDMSQCVQEWNDHFIRNTNCDSPSGRPNIMYCHPELYDAVDYKISMNPVDIETVIAEYCTESIYCCDPHFQQRCEGTLNDNARAKPLGVAEATNTFIWLCSKMEGYL